MIVNKSSLLTWRKPIYRGLSLPGFNPLLAKRDNNHSIAPEPSLPLLHRLQSPPAPAVLPLSVHGTGAVGGPPFPSSVAAEHLRNIAFGRGPGAALVAPYYLPSISTLCLELFCRHKAFRFEFTVLLHVQVRTYMYPRLDNPIDHRLVPQHRPIK